MRSHKHMGMLAAVGLAVLAAGSVSARAAELFTTQEDFTGWSGNGSTAITVGSQASPDTDGSSVNGAGNVSNAGGTGTPGSLSLAWNSGTYDFIYSGGEQGNAAFLSALGSSGTIDLDVIAPPAGTGNYFGLGVVLNYANGFDQFFPSTTSTVGNVTTEVIPYTLSHPASTYSYFQFGLIYNSNYNTPAPFTVDNILVQPVPEPASLSLLGLGGLLAMRRRR